VSSPAIHLDGLAKYFGRVIGVDGLSLAVERGEVFGFLGANGAGKTTTIRLLLDLLRPSRGRALVLGVDCHRASREARRLIGYLPGELPIYRDLSAAAYLAHLRAIDGRPVTDGYLRELLRRFDVSDVDLRRPLRDQSHGMKQKIGIVQALMGRAPVVILDEPTSGLDPLMSQAFGGIVHELKRDGGTTIFLSSHVLGEVESTCDRIGIIRAGRMVTVGTVDDLRRASPRRVTVRFAADVGEVPACPDTTLIASGPRECEFEVRGPLGPLLATLAPLPIYDLVEQPFRLEDAVVRFYAESGRWAG
jgi:beta-exotoxin I transport system ATP-binding protein